MRSMFSSSPAVNLPTSLTVKKKWFPHGRTIGCRAQVGARTGLHTFPCLKRWCSGRGCWKKWLQKEVGTLCTWILWRREPPGAKQGEKPWLGQHGCYGRWLTFALKTKSLMGHWVWSRSIRNLYTTPWEIRDEWAGNINVCDRKLRARVACKMGRTQHSVITWSQPGTQLSLESQRFLELQ